MKKKKGVKKDLVAYGLVCLVFFMVSCAFGESPAPVLDGPATLEAPKDGPEEDPEADAHNAPLLCEALQIEEDDRSMSFLLTALRVIEAGKIQDLELREEDGWRALYFTGEDGTHFRMLLSSGGTADAVENLDTGEWPIMSLR